MRTSQVTVLSAIGIVVLIIVGLILGLRIAVSSVTDGPDTRDLVMRSVALDGFTEIVVEDAWHIEITRSDDWSLEIGVPDGSDVDLDVVGNALILEADSNANSERGGLFGHLFGGGSRQYLARIGMPDLERIDIDGAGNVEITGFDGDELTIGIRGGANVEGHESRFTNVRIDVSGGALVDLSGLSAVNAEVDLSGAANIKLAMDGGALTGELTGFGKVSYAGEVSREDVNIAGFGSVGPTSRRPRISR
jgi:hypothetical protein